MTKNNNRSNNVYIFFSLEYIFNVSHSIFPYSFMFVIQYIMPLCVVISFIYSVAILVQSIVYEKEQRLKEVMKMMGLSNAVHWTAWFITSIVSMLTIVILLTIVLKVGDTVVAVFLLFFLSCLLKLFIKIKILNLIKK